MMATALRTALKRAVAGVLESEGYVRRLPPHSTARARDLDPPLTAVITPVIEGHRWGGASLTATVKITLHRFRRS